MALESYLALSKYFNTYQLHVGKQLKLPPNFSFIIPKGAIVFIPRS